MCEPNDNDDNYIFRCYQRLMILMSVPLLSFTQGKQDVINSKIHYLSLNPEKEASGPLSRSYLNNYKNRLKLKSRIKESKKIDVDVQFMNNGRPFRVNSKRSNSLQKIRKRKGVLLRGTGPNNKVTIKTIKHIKNKTGHSEKVEHSSHESRNADEAGSGDKRENVKSQTIKQSRGKLEADSSTGLSRHQISGMCVFIVNFRELITNQ